MIRVNKLFFSLLLPLTVFADNWLLCPTDGSLSFVEGVSTKSVKSTNVKSGYKITYWNMNQNKQENTVDCLEINTAGNPSNNSSNVSWTKNTINPIPFTPDNMSATIYPQPNSPKNQVPKSLKFGVNGTLFVVINSAQYSCPNVTIAMGTYEFNFSNVWWIFNNNTNNAHSINCYDQNNNPTSIYLIPPNATGVYDGRKSQDFVMQFSLSPNSQLWIDLFSGMYTPGHA
jgi:hypothetical protein